MRKIEIFAITRWLINFVANIGLFANESTKIAGKVLLNVFTVIAPAIAPLGPAIMFAYNFYASAIGDVDHQWALWASVAVGGALECAGIIASKTAIRWVGEYQKSKDGLGGPNTEAKTKLYLAMSIVFMYFMSGIGTSMLEHTSDSMRVLTFICFVIAMITYAATGLWEDSEKSIEYINKAHEDQKEEEKLRIEYEREQDALDRQAKRELALARLAAKKEVAVAQATAPPVNAQLVPRQSNSQSQQNTTGSIGYTHWRNIPDNEKVMFANMSVEQICLMNPEISRRTARNWRNSSQKMIS